MWLFLLALFQLGVCSIDGTIDLASNTGKRKVEDSIPIIEIRGEGKPMTSAQIRHLEEMSNGGKPLDIKTEKTFVPAKCPRKAERKDFVTFHYKVFLEDNRKIYQTYNEAPVRIQLGVGMTLPGLDKGLQGICSQELRKIQIPYRMAQRSKSKVWKHIPTDEHWISLNVDIQDVEPYSHDLQFNFMDVNNDTVITEKDLIDWQNLMKTYGKVWRNADIDKVMAAKYYIKYFDMNEDGKITKDEWLQITERDEKLMSKNEDKSNKKGRKRDPGMAWVLDFNNDGVITQKEEHEADQLFEKDPQLKPIIAKDEL